MYLKNSKTSILGSWAENNDLFYFRPVVPFTDGKTYLVKTASEVLDTFRPELIEYIPSRILGIYPSTDTVPENLLKIYITFSRPMGEQLSGDFITVLNPDGDSLTKVFLPLQPELWNKSRDCLTLWLDPGRIKRDLGPNLWLGTPLVKGQSYKIVIASQWKDQMGYPLASSFEKTFTVREPDRIKPDPRDWRVEIPKSGTRQPLRIHFRESLDFSLLSDCINIFQVDTIPGKVTISDNQDIWIFTPELDWESGFYKIGIDSRLEDLAGNNMIRLFDEEIKDTFQPYPAAGTVILDLQIP
ncbi:MAG: hypothetical protein KDC80_04560 [Saprospiraceae bacterium]|nr:hypothetical protein [Saprospiraceae bacterium]